MSGISPVSGSGSGQQHPFAVRGDPRDPTPAGQNGERAAGAEKVTKAPGKPGQPGELSRDEVNQIMELRTTDMKVRAHEMAHLAASGGFATSGAKFEYAVGPDGKSYAVAGEVSIDTSPVKDDPHATMAKARTIRGAALAPADPSGADRAVAAAAAQMEAEAAQQLARARDEEAREPGQHLDFTA